MSGEDGLDGILDGIKMGRWQLLAFLINCLVWSVLSPHTIGNTLLNAPVSFKCLPPDDPYFRYSNIGAEKDKEKVEIVLVGEETGDFDNATTAFLSENVTETTESPTQTSTASTSTTAPSQSTNATSSPKDEVSTTSTSRSSSVSSSTSTSVTKSSTSTSDPATSVSVSINSTTTTTVTGAPPPSTTQQSTTVSVSTESRKPASPPASVASAESNSSESANLTLFDNQCFDSPPLHVLPGIYDTENSSWVVDDHGHLHKLEPWEEVRLREANEAGKILEVAVPSCPSVVYDDSVFTETITTEWHLICERTLHRQLFQNTYTIGIMVGCIFGGDIGDRLGRVMAIRILAILHVISSLIVAFTTNFTALLVARFFVGLSNLGILVPAVTLALETCPGRFRGPVGMAVGLPYSLGVFCFGVLGYWLRSWRYLYMASSFPAFLMLPISFFLDESPRWLLQKHRIEQAKDVLTKGAKMNRSQLPPEEELNAILLQVAKKESSEETQNEENKLSIRDRIKSFFGEAASFVATPSMRRISIVLPINWIFSEIIYYGIIFNANNFSHTNPFMYVALTGVSDAIAIFIGAPVSKMIGRKKSVGIGQFGAGLLTILVLVVPDNVRWLQWILVMGGFLLSAAAAQILYVYTPELYPTTLRSRGFAFCNLTGYAGAFFAPFIPEVLSTFGWWVTDVTLGVAGILGGLIIFTLPETNNLPLCETVDDVEARFKERRRKAHEKRNKKKTGDELKKEQTQEEEEEGGGGKPSDGQIVKDIILTNSFKFAPKSSIRSSVRAQKIASNSINCLLECPKTLTTDSFGIKSPSPPNGRLQKSLPEDEDPSETGGLETIIEKERDPTLAPRIIKWDKKIL